MPVECPICGLSSQEESVCENCQTDLQALTVSPPPSTCPVSSTLSLPINKVHQKGLSSPLNPIILQTEDQAWRVHWLTPEGWEFWRPQVTHRQSCRAGVLPPAQVVEELSGTWLIVETTLDRAQPWLDLSQDPIEQLRQVFQFTEKLTDALESLHTEGLTWLTFDPEEIEYAAGSEESRGLQITNLDLQVYPTRRSPDQLHVLNTFAAPEIWRFETQKLGPRTDVYHLGLYIYYLLAGLLPEGFPGQGLEAFNFFIPPLRIFSPHIPPRVESVIARAVAENPDQRFASANEFCASLKETLERAEKRWSAPVSVGWEIGWRTHVGKAKEALKKNNEDYALVRGYSNPDRALAVVADGISLCDIGNGALASRMASLVVENEFDDGCGNSSFEDKFVQACLRASQVILDWALDQGFKQALLNGKNLMGSTLTAAWVEGDTITLGNLGDSRAYLIEDGHVEQLTVDGDLGSALLATKVPPEEVDELGTLGFALRYCVGGSISDEGGKISIQEEHCHPTFSTWPIQPGDVIVLCTDGLVEEGVFLQPEDLGKLAMEDPSLSAEDLANKLVEEANKRQRPPSELEPDGYGDNITCVVIKVHPRD